MLQYHTFTGGPFQENAVLIHNTQEAWIVDPGFYNSAEEENFVSFLNQHNLKLTRLLNTHAHIDHVMGNAFIFEKFGLLPEMHRADLPTFDLAEKSAQMYGLNYTPSPKPVSFIKEGEHLFFGDVELEIRFVPGHAPGHVVFIDHQAKTVVNGDCLFSGSIGRTDLPGGNHEQLLNAIKEQLYTLPNDYTVICGHGPNTTIGKEKTSNPFVKN